jgi:hypothetical protein
MIKESMKLNFLHHIGNGMPKSTACKLSGICRETFRNWRMRDAEFAKAFQTIWESVAEKRAFHLWQNHPFRGKRPPTGKGKGGKPRYGAR